jgi:hypothetical protein
VGQASPASPNAVTNSDRPPQAPPRGPFFQHWEWALNATCSRVGILDVQAVFEKYFLPDLQKHLRIKEARQTLLAAILPPGDGQTHRLSLAGESDADVGGASWGGMQGGGRRRRAGAAVVSSYAQTEGWWDVKNDELQGKNFSNVLFIVALRGNTRALTFENLCQELNAAYLAQLPEYLAERLLSPRAQVTREEAEVVGDDGVGVEAEAARRQAPAQQQQQQQQQQQHGVTSPVKREGKGKGKAVVEETVQMWYTF